MQDVSESNVLIIFKNSNQWRITIEKKYFLFFLIFFYFLLDSTPIEGLCEVYIFSVNMTFRPLLFLFLWYIRILRNSPAA